MTRMDKLIALVVVLIAGILFGLRYLPVASEALRVEVTVAGDIVQTLDLDETENQIIFIEVAGGRAGLEIKDKGVRLLEAAGEFCPRKICIQTGWIRRSGESIICLPNRMVIRLRSSSRPQFDAITK